MAKNKLDIEIGVDSGKAEDNLGKVNKGLKETGDTAEKSGAGFGTMAIGIAAATVALTALISAGKEFVEGAQVQELAEVGLKVALEKQGDAAGKAFKSLQKLASARQGVTTVGDEITLAFSNILILGGQTAEAVEELIPTIQDLGAAYELAGNGTADYSKIALTVNKIIKTGAGDLSKFGVVLTATEKKTIIAANESERQAFLMEKVAAAAGGMSEVLAGTSSGSMTQFNNIVGDIKENLGFMIIEGIMPLVKIGKKIAAFFSDLTDRSGALAKVLRVILKIAIPLGGAFILLAAGMGIYIAASALLAASNVSLAGTFTALWAAATGPVGLVIAAIVAIGAAIFLLIDNVKPLKDALVSVWDAIIKGWEIISPIFGMLFDIIGDIGGLIFDMLITPFKILFNVLKPIAIQVWEFVSGLLGLNKAGGESVDVFGLLKTAMEFVKKGFISMKLAIGGLKAVVDEVVKIVTELVNAFLDFDFSKIVNIFSDAGKRTGAAFRKGVEEEIKKLNLEQELEKWADAFEAAAAKKAKRDADALKDKKKTGGGGGTGKDLASARAAELARQHEAFLDHQAKEFEAEFLAEDARTALKLQKEKEREAILEEQRLSWLEHMSDEEFKQILADNEAAKQLAIDKEDAKQEAAAVTFALAKDLFGENFDMQKAFAASEAGMSVFQAATKALTAGPIIGPILAGIITTLGAIKVGKILSEKKPSFAGGGFTGNQGRDQVAGVVHGQEFVTNAAATAQHRTGLELINAGISPEDAFDLQMPGNIPSQSGMNEILLKAQFKIEGGDLVAVVIENIQQTKTGTM